MTSLLPSSSYLRRRHVRDYLGITDEEFSALVRAEVLRPVYFRGAGRAFFRRDELLTAEADGKIFKPKTNTTTQPAILR